MKRTLIILFVLFSNFAFGQMPNTLTNAEKIYGLSKFWQEVNYNFVYLNKVDLEKWNAEYKKLITEVQNTKNDYEYYRLLKKFCAMLEDGHTNIYFPETIKDNLLRNEFGKYRLFFTNIEGKAIVTRVNGSKKDEIPLGTEIVKVNGLQTQDYINKYVKPYISSSTSYILDDSSVINLFKSPKGTAFDVEIKLPNGKAKSLKLTVSENNEKVYPPFERDEELMEFKWVDKKIAYLSLNSFANSAIDSLFLEKLPELQKAKALIIDLRNNGGGSTGIGLEIFKYLTNDTILYGSKSQTRMHLPAYKAWGKWVEAKDTVDSKWAKKSFLAYRDELYYNFDYEPDTVSKEIKRIVVPTVLLTGHWTASAAEDFLIYANNQEHITKIGEPTYGSTGQPMTFVLPGGGSARICTKKDTYPDGREFVGFGVQPDIKVHKTLKDYLNNNDPDLDKAIEYLKKEK